MFSTLAVAESVPVPSKRPQTFYASPEILKEIRQRMAEQQVAPAYRVSKFRHNNYEVMVKDTDKEAVLEHLRNFNIEGY